MRRKSSKELTQEEIDMVARTIVICQNEKENMPKVLERASQLTGVSYVKVNEINSVLQSGKWPHKQQSSRGKYTRKSSIHQTERIVLSNIHDTVQKIAIHGGMPTEKKIRKRLDFYYGVSLKPHTLRRLLKMMGYSYRQPKSDEHYVKETKELKEWRSDFVKKVKELREAGYYVVYLDETYVNEGHVATRCWIRNGDKVKVPSGKGKRWILFHAGGDRGWVPGAVRLFQAKHSADYHDAMNQAHFSEMFISLCEVLEKEYGKCVIVSDNAAYHKAVSNPESRITYWTKKRRDELIDLWNAGKIPGQSGAAPKTKKNIMSVIRANLPEPSFEMMEMAEQLGHKVLFLPPYHPKLNPIEYAWAIIKNHVADNNEDGFTFTDVKRLIDDGITKVTAQTWSRLVQRARNCEEIYRAQAQAEEKQAQEFMDRNPSLIFTLSSEDESDSSDTESTFSDLDISRFSDGLSGQDSHIFVESFAESYVDEQIDSDNDIDCSIDNDVTSCAAALLRLSEIRFKT